MHGPNVAAVVVAREITGCCCLRGPLLGGWCGTGRPEGAIVEWMLPRSHHRVFGGRAEGMVRGLVGLQGAVRVAVG